MSYMARHRRIQRAINQTEKQRRTEYAEAAQSLVSQQAAIQTGTPEDAEYLTRSKDPWVRSCAFEAQRAFTGNDETRGKFWLERAAAHMTRSIHEGVRY